MKTVIITGSRKYNKGKTIRIVMEGLLQEFGIYKVRHGNAKGADTLADSRARLMKLPDIYGYVADWDRYDKAAGPIRNKEMLLTEIEKEGRENILVIAFPLPDSKGTYHMINFARDNQVEVRIYDIEGKEIHGRY